MFWLRFIPSPMRRSAAALVSTLVLVTGCTVTSTAHDITVDRPEIDLGDRLAQRDLDLLGWLNDMPVIATRGSDGRRTPGPIVDWTHETPKTGELFWRDTERGTREFVYVWLPQKGGRQVGRAVLQAMGPPGDSLVDWMTRRRKTVVVAAPPFSVDDVDGLRAEYFPAYGSHRRTLIYLFGSLDGPQHLERLAVDAFRFRGNDVVLIEDPRSARELGSLLTGSQLRLWESDFITATRRRLPPSDDVTDCDCRLYYKALLTAMTVATIDSKIATSMSGFEAVAAHVEARRTVPTTARVFVGGSYGATVGPALLATSSRSFDAAAFIAGGADLLPVGSRLINSITVQEGPCPPPALTEEDKRQIRSTYLSTVELDPYHWASQVTVPSLIVEAAFDRIFDAESRRLLRDRIPHAEVWRVPAGHIGLFVFGMNMNRVADWVDEQQLEPVGDGT